MSIVDKLVKKFNNEDVIKFSEKDNFKEMKSWAFSGCPELDYNLGTLGFPTGIIEIAGKSRSGKTTMGLAGMFHFLKNEENGIAVILSSENRDNKAYAEKMGIDTDRVIIMKVRYMEKMFIQVKTLITETCELFAEEKLGEPKFYFLWDSLGATLSKSELDTMEENTNEMEKKQAKGEDLEKLKHEKIGAFAKPAKMFAKFLLGEMYDKTIHFIMLNHQYDNIGGHGKTSTGGTWVELFPTLRLQTTLIENIKVGEEEVAQITRIKVIKNDFGSRKVTDVEVLLGVGIVLNEVDIEYAVSKGILKKEGAKKLSFMDDKLKWSTKREFYANYSSKNKFLPILLKKIAQARHDDTNKEKDSQRD